MNTVTFKLDDKENERIIELTVTVSDHVDSLVASFEAFMLAAGFSKTTIQKTFSAFGDE